MTMFEQSPFLKSLMIVLQRGARSKHSVAKASFFRRASMLSHLSLSDVGYTELAVGGSLAAPWLLIPFVAVFSWIDDLRWRAQMNALKDKVEPKNVERFAQSV